jgi:signal transduction histidine kinase
MKRFRILIFLFCIGLSIPLGYLILRTYDSLEAEARGQLRFFAETIFGEMEGALADRVRREEARAVDEYNPRYAPPGGGGATVPSPLSRPPDPPYILGYFQNNPDGSFQTPLTDPDKDAPAGIQARVRQLETANAAFNGSRHGVTGAEADIMDWAPAPVPDTPAAQQTAPGYADRFLSRSQRQKSVLGQSKKRVEEITVDQALNLAKADRSAGSADDEAAAPPPSAEAESSRRRADAPASYLRDERRESAAPRSDGLTMPEGRTLQAEVDPLQAIFLSEDQIFIFRRIILDNRIYRQGFVIKVGDFLDHLAIRYFADQPMARFTALHLRADGGPGHAPTVRAGAPVDHPRYVLERTFPRPFSFLRATLTCQEIPPTEGRKTLTLMVAVLAGVLLAGLLAIHHSVRVVVDLSERRSRFVSSVTHELKTPLTNIRMYIEMLEGGIARSREREAEYYRILGAECARLSRLINNVLELSRLEKKQLRLDLREGDFSEVIDEVRRIMGPRLAAEGVVLTVDRRPGRDFRYDPEVMIQVLINLMENSLKFGKSAPEKRITLTVTPEKNRMVIRLSDTGPGIPRRDLKKVFDDFYRVDSPDIRTTRGTGIGLAFVKKVIQLAGGRVSAKNNDGPGCTITISLPA